MADKVIAHFKKNNGIKTHIDAFKQIFDNNLKSDVAYVLTILEEKNIVKCADGFNRQIFYLTPEGWNYTSYDEIIKKENIKKEKKDLKDEIDLRNAERVFKTYNSTRFIAWATFIITIILALLKLAEVLKFWPYK